MSLLLCLDESGHDHHNMPYEVHGGVTLHARKLWPFVQALMTLEQACFGDRVSRFRKEIKGSNLLDKDRFKWAAQGGLMEETLRRKNCLSFLNKGLNRQVPNRDEFTAYGQACLQMARGIFDLIASHDGKILAVAIPKKLPQPPADREPDLLRKDLVFLLERYFYMLEHANEMGLIVLDETEKMQDRRFVRMLERYFQETITGRYRSTRIVPSPFFVASDMAYPVQVADVVIYALNWGFRLPQFGMNASTRPEIEAEFAGLIGTLQFRGDGYRDGQVFKTFGIAYVPDLYTARI
jgi:Protein of unknown function (DUF3800)